MPLDRKQEIEAKRLFLSGFSSEEISYILRVDLTDLKDWIKSSRLESLQTACDVRLSRLQSWVLSSLLRLEAGKKPDVKSQEILRYVSAYDKLSRHGGGLSYYFDAFESLTHALMRSISASSSERQRSLALARLKYVRSCMEEVIDAKIKLSTE
ncbi:MAG: hypothetical protein OXB93_03455 [Cytophagales bacterium]|nr:hypothetical protein [Cytophagales bacterium]